MPGAKLSEHAHGDALDVRALHLADGRRLELTDVRVDKPLREGLRESACHRFTTVLGPGDPTFHEGHIHLDVIQRRAATASANGRCGNRRRRCRCRARARPTPRSVKHSRKTLSMPPLSLHSSPLALPP